MCQTHKRRCLYKSYKHVLKKKKHRKNGVKSSEKENDKACSSPVLSCVWTEPFSLTVSMWFSGISRKWKLFLWLYRGTSFEITLFLFLSMLMNFNSWFEFLCPIGEGHIELFLLGHYICKLLTQPHRGESGYRVWRS